MVSDLLSNLVSTPDMDRVFSDANQVKQMLRFEAALSGALEDCGLAHAGAAAPLEALLHEDFLTPTRAAALQASARAAGNLAIPFVKLLTAAVAEHHPAAARHIHTGATSQDVLDTALVLQLQQAFPLIGDAVDQLHATCAALARTHAATVMAGRTWLQQGPPVTLGLKLAGWADALARHRERLDQTAARALRLQFGGAVGTLASLGPDGLRVSAALARRLDLAEPPLPWHTHRDTLAEVAATLGLLTGSLGKFARDLSLLMQTEVAEALEPSAPGRGGSSTMPHKRNPVASAAVLAAAIRVPSLVATMLAAMPQEHERGLGGWQAEWQTLPEILRLTAGALSQMHDIAAGLDVRPGRMAANLAASHGLSLAEAVSAALAPHLGREKAHALLEAASHEALASNRTLRAALDGLPEVTHHLTGADLDSLLDPANYLGSTAALIARALKD